MLNDLLHRLRAVAQHVSVERIRFYFLLLGIILVAFTVAFHELYPVLEGKPITWTGSVLFVVETLSTTGYGDLLPFSNNMTSLLATLMMGTGVVLFFMAVPVLLTPFIARVIRTSPPRRTGRAFAEHTVIVGYDDTVRSILESLRVGDVRWSSWWRTRPRPCEHTRDTGGTRTSSGAIPAPPRPRQRPRSGRPGTWSWSGASRRSRTRSWPSGTAPRPR
jgi:hypothetical protein